MLNFGISLIRVILGDFCMLQYFPINHLFASQFKNLFNFFYAYNLPLILSMLPPYLHATASIDYLALTKLFGMSANRSKNQKVWKITYNAPPIMTPINPFDFFFNYIKKKLKSCLWSKFYPELVKKSIKVPTIFGWGEQCPVPLFPHINQHFQQYHFIA